VASDEYAQRVAERLMSRSQIRCIETADGYRFVASCPCCGNERLLVMAERDARRMYCCSQEWRLIPYNKKFGLELQQGLKNYMRREGIPGWDKVKSWDEYNEKIRERAKCIAERNR